MKVGLAAVLVFVGVKMVVSDIYKVPIWASLLVIALTIAVSIVASLRRTTPAVLESARRKPGEAR